MTKNVDRSCSLSKFSSRDSLSQSTINGIPCIIGNDFNYAVFSCASQYVDYYKMERCAKKEGNQSMYVEDTSFLPLTIYHTKTYTSGWSRCQADGFSKADTRTRYYIHTQFTSYPFVYGLLQHYFRWYIWLYARVRTPPHYWRTYINKAEYRMYIFMYANNRVYSSYSISVAIVCH